MLWKRNKKLLNFPSWYFQIKPCCGQAFFVTLVAKNYNDLIMRIFVLHEVWNNCWREGADTALEQIKRQQYVKSLKGYFWNVIFAGEYSCVKKPWFRRSGNQPSEHGNHLRLAWLPLIRNRANVKPRTSLRGVSRIYIGEISCILYTCQLVS